MSVPSDVTPNVAEAAEAMGETASRIRERSRSLFRRVPPEQYGFAAAALVAFLGVAVCGPRLQAMRKQRHRRMIDRVGRATDRAMRQARQQARDVGGAASLGMRQLGETLPGAR